MSALGQTRTLHNVRVTSALPPKGDIRRQPFDVGFGPERTHAPQDFRDAERHKLPRKFRPDIDDFRSRCHGL